MIRGRACQCAAIGREGTIGRSYHLVGDVRWNARTYLAELAVVLGRPLRFHPRAPTRPWLAPYGPCLIRRALGQAVPRPDRRDLLSCGLRARFDCTDAKRDLDWQPVADEATFRARAVAVHAPAP